MIAHRRARSGEKVGGIHVQAHEYEIGRAVITTCSAIRAEQLTRLEESVDHLLMRLVRVGPELEVECDHVLYVTIRFTDIGKDS